jgi:hypothetical protein
MRKWFFATAAVSVLALASVAIAAGPNFSGTWVLDKSKSSGLAGPRGGGIDSMTLTVTQDANKLTVASKTTMAAGEGGGPGGGGGMRRGGGMGGGDQTFTYNLDGSESKTDIAGRMEMKATLKAKIDDSGAELDQERTGNFNGNEFTMTQKEHWVLSEGGKVLTIHRTTESPRGSRESTLVFNKQ